MVKEIDCENIQKFFIAQWAKNFAKHFLQISLTIFENNTFGHNFFVRIDVILILL